MRTIKKKVNGWDIHIQEIDTVSFPHKKYYLGWCGKDTELEKGVMAGTTVCLGPYESVSNVLRAFRSFQKKEQDLKKKVAEEEKKRAEDEMVKWNQVEELLRKIFEEMGIAKIFQENALRRARKDLIPRENDAG